MELRKWNLISDFFHLLNIITSTVFSIFYIVQHIAHIPRIFNFPWMQKNSQSTMQQDNKMFMDDTYILENCC